MKKFISAALVVAMVAASCTSKEDLGNNNAPDGGVTFSADFAEPMSKVAPDYSKANRAVAALWEVNDKVGVYAADGAPAEFAALTAGATTTLKGFIEPEAGNYYAMYPYDADAIITDGVISTELPAIQYATKDAFAAHLAVASTTESSFSFQNVCALVRVYIGYGKEVTKLEFRGNSNETVAGEITVKAATAEYTATGANEVITVLPSEGSTTFEAGAYYFSVLPQKFANGFTVNYHGTSGNVYSSAATTEVTIPRSSLVVGKAFTDITGAGTTEAPFVIQTVNDLRNLSAVLRLGGVVNYVELANDIDMDGVETWTPINNNRIARDVPVVNFDGKGKTIKNFAPSTIPQCGVDDKGNPIYNASLWGVFVGKCKDLVVKDADMDLGETSTTAVLASFGGYNINGYNTYDSRTVFENIRVSGSVSGKKVVAGLVASAYNAKFTNCFSDVEVNGADYHLGGLVGRCEGGYNLFEKCAATGNVTGTIASRCVGGLIGGDFASTNQSELEVVVDQSYATGQITALYQVGALLGCGRDSTHVKNSYATGKIVSFNDRNSKHVGGIVGAIYGGAQIQKSYYCGGKFDSFITEGAGGILGVSAKNSLVKINNCFAVVDFTSSATTMGAVGGIVGAAKGRTEILLCYAKGEKSQTAGGAILGKAEVDGVSVKKCFYDPTLSENIVGDTSSKTPTTEENSELTMTENQTLSDIAQDESKLKFLSKYWVFDEGLPYLKNNNNK